MLAEVEASAASTHLLHQEEERSMDLRPRGDRPRIATHMVAQISKALKDTERMGGGYRNVQTKL